jgi:hypothetical protein
MHMNTDTLSSLHRRRLLKAGAALGSLAALGLVPAARA